MIDLIKRHEGFAEASQAYKWAEQQGYWENGHATRKGTGNGKAKDDSATTGALHGYNWKLLGLNDDEDIEEQMRQWFAEHLLPETGVALFSGQWGTLKTFVAMDLSAAAITKTPFINFPITRQGGVLYIATESQGEINIRITAALKARGYTDKRRPFTWVTECPPLLRNKHAAEILIAMVGQANAFMRRVFSVPLVLVVVDALGKAAGYWKQGQEDDAALTKIMLGILAKVSMATGTFFVAVTHFGKNIETGTRGSSVHEDDADVVLAMVGDKAISGKMSNLRLYIRKRKTGTVGDEFVYQTRTMVIGPNGEDTLVLNWVIEPEAVAAAGAQSKKKKQKWDGVGMKILRQVLTNALANPQQMKKICPWSDGPIVRAVDQEVLRDPFYRSYPAADKTDPNKIANARRQAFKRAVEKAVEQNLVKAWEMTDSNRNINYIWMLSDEPPPHDD